MVYINLISVRGVELHLIQFRDRNLFGLCLAIENDLDLVSGSKLAWILGDGVRSQIEMES